MTFKQTRPNELILLSYPMKKKDEKINLTSVMTQLVKIYTLNLKIKYHS